MRTIPGKMFNFKNEFWWHQWSVFILLFYVNWHSRSRSIRKRGNCLASQNLFSFSDKLNAMFTHHWALEIELYRITQKVMPLCVLCIVFLHFLFSLFLPGVWYFRFEFEYFAIAFRISCIVWLFCYSVFGPTHNYTIYWRTTFASHRCCVSLNKIVHSRPHADVDILCKHIILSLATIFLCSAKKLKQNFTPTPIKLQLNKSCVA